MYLHEAIIKVVEEAGNRPVDIRIAKAINERGLYHTKDGSVVTPLERRSKSNS